MTEEAIGIGAATEPRASFAEEPPWVQVHPMELNKLRLSCLRCVASETIKLPREAGRLADDLAHFARRHALCDRGQM